MANLLKAQIAKFVEETQSTDIYKFLAWLDCKEELIKEIERQMKTTRL